MKLNKLLIVTALVLGLTALMAPALPVFADDDTDCCGTDDVVITLKLKNTGEAKTEVLVVYKTGLGNPVFFTGDVGAGGEFTVADPDPQGNQAINPWITVYVDDVLIAEKHTSCSEEIYIGEILKHPTTGALSDFMITAVTTNDAGVCSSPLGSIGNYVWHDVNMNGLQNAGESGLDGVTVNLYDSSHNPKGTTTTSGGGLYTFTNLAPGDYYVEFVLPDDDYSFTLQDRGSNDAVDSDADPTTGKTVVTTLLAGETDLTWDAGLHLCDIGDRVWKDEDGQGDQNGTEPGFNDVDVYLFTDTGITPTCAITETGYVTHTVTISGTSQEPPDFSDGIYLFDMESLGLGPGEYWVCVDEDTLPTGQWALTTGSNPQHVNYAGSDDFSIDFGFAPMVDLALTKTLDTTSPYSEGQLVTFSITVTNEGGVDATGVQVEDFNWTKLTDPTPDSGGVLSGTTSVIWDLPDVGAGVGNLPAGASATMHITFTVTATGYEEFSNAAEIYDCDQTDVDSIPNNGWALPGGLEDDIASDNGAVAVATAVTLSSFAAKSSAGGSVNLLWPGLAGLTVLAAGSLFWAKRRTS